MYCKFSAVSSNVLDVISILVSEIMVMNIVCWYSITIDDMLSGSRPLVDLYILVF